MLVDSLSYSSFTQLLRNPLIFKLKHVLGIYESKRSVSSMIGSAGHEALRFYYGGDKDRGVPADHAEAMGDAIETGLKFLTEYQDAYINYGKTGSREAMLKGYAQAMRFYFAEEPKYHEILMCEEKITAEMKTLAGDPLPLPASGIPDIVEQLEDGSIQVIDNKFVKSFTKFENEDGDPHEDYIKIVQAMFLKHLLLAKGIKATRCLFREIKRTENKDGGPQIQDYSVPFDHEPYDIIFYNLYRDVVEFLKNPHAIFLPNLSDPFDGETAGLLYAQGLISSDMSDVEVMHKVKDVAFVSKKFVPSRLDRAENAFLPPPERIRMRLMEFGIPLEVEGTEVGANITQYRFKISAGVAMARIKKHKDDILQALQQKGEIRILTPIPGTNLVGIEIENVERTSVKLSKDHLVMGTLTLPIGVDVRGEATKVTLDSMPHILVAGATGAGKSVLVHNFLDALTKQMTPEEMHLTLIDPKRVELTAYARKPHLHGSKVIFEYEHAVKALLELVDVMDERYALLEKAEKRDISAYNAAKRKVENRLPYRVVVIDEFADFILRAKLEKARWKQPNYASKSKRALYTLFKKREPEYSSVMPIEGYDKDALIDLLEAQDSKNVMMREDADIELLMVRLAQLGRAAGIHLIVATQRPSADVITGLIKANFPTRIALTTASAVDSVVILGKPGAEKLAGKGDMLFVHPALKGEVRLQGFNLTK